MMKYLSIGAIFEQENSWLDEWIRYHMGIGVEHFYLYNHDPDPKVSDRILLPYVGMGVVDNIHVREHETLQGTSRPFMQPAAMKDAIERGIGNTRWLAMIDLDEFILPKQHDDLRETLRDYEEYSGLIVHWQQFGTSGYIRRPPTQVDHLLRRAASTHWTGRQFKSIMNPEKVDGKRILQERERPYTPHIFPIHSGATVDERHEEIEYDKILQPFSGETAVINHYILRSFQDYWEIKAPRGRFNGMHDFPVHYWKENDLNDVFDDEISKRFGHFVK